MDAPIRRPSNVDKMLLGGRYVYTDFAGALPVQVEVEYELGTCWVHFPPLDDDHGAQVRLMDMAAWENWREHFERIG